MWRFYIFAMKKCYHAVMVFILPCWFHLFLEGRGGWCDALICLWIWALQNLEGAPLSLAVVMSVCLSGCEFVCHNNCCSNCLSCSLPSERKFCLGYSKVSKYQTTSKLQNWLASYSDFIDKKYFLTIIFYVLMLPFTKVKSQIYWLQKASIWKSIEITLLCILGELAGGGSFAVAVGVSDRWQVRGDTR